MENLFLPPELEAKAIAIGLSKIQVLDNFGIPIEGIMYQQILDLFEEKHNIFIMPYPRDGWNYLIQKIDETISLSGESKHGERFKTKYEALNEAIEESFGLISSDSNVNINLTQTKIDELNTIVIPRNLENKNGDSDYRIELQE